MVPQKTGKRKAVEELPRDKRDRKVFREGRRRVQKQATLKERPLVMEGHRYRQGKSQNHGEKRSVARRVSGKGGESCHEAKEG